MGPSQNSALLAVCIPTFERPEFVRYQLTVMGPLFHKYQIPVVISDNSPGLETKHVVESFSGQFEILYSQNETNIADRNFIKAVGIPNTDYRWIISDSTILDGTCIERVLEVCKSHVYDYVVLNSGRAGVSPDRELGSPIEALKEIGWHLTLISTYVFSRNVVAQSDRILRYRNGNFLHHALLFELWPLIGSRVFWIGTNKYQKVPMTKTNSWGPLTYEIWVKRWTEYVLSLPDYYPLEAKKGCIKSHEATTGMFGYGKIIKHRMNGILSPAVLRKYRDYLPLAVRHWRFMTWAARVPRFLARCVDFAATKSAKIFERFQK